MNVGVVTISVEEYSSLVKIAANVECLRRYVKATSAARYISIDEIKAILDMYIPDGTEGTCISE